jgi:hypothetical protein
MPHSLQNKVQLHQLHLSHLTVVPQRHPLPTQPHQLPQH